MTDANILKLWGLFRPDEITRRDAFQKRGGRFVHYTSAQAAMSIFQKKRIWMREASTMNDFMEIEHGLRCIRQGYNDEKVGKRFKDVLNEISPDLSKTLEDRFNEWIPVFRNNTYLTCISEHDDREDVTGRLSMWRAYGGATSVALVMNNNIFYSESDALKAYSSTVRYMREDDYLKYFEVVVDNLEKNIDYLKTFGKDAIFNVAFTSLRFAMLCTKHPGFHEEREWRVIYSPSLEKSEFIEPAIELVRGVPQLIQKIPLINRPKLNLTDIELPELINRVIIGPTEHPRAIRDAFIKLMEEAGIKDAQKKIWVSDIPLRNS